MRLPLSENVLSIKTADGNFKGSIWEEVSRLCFGELEWLVLWLVAKQNFSLVARLIRLWLPSLFKARRRLFTVRRRLCSFQLPHLTLDRWVQQASTRNLHLKSVRSSIFLLVQTHGELDELKLSPRLGRLWSVLAIVSCGCKTCYTTLES